MGWCGGIEIFDSIVKSLLNNDNTKAALKEIVIALEYADRDCQQDSEYWEHPMIQEIMKEIHPNWFEDEL